MDNISVIQHFSKKENLTFDEFVGEMRKRGCSGPTATKIWNGEYETYEEFSDNNVNLSNLRKAADILRVGTGNLIPR